MGRGTSSNGLREDLVDGILFLVIAFLGAGAMSLLSLFDGPIFYWAAHVSAERRGRYINLDLKE